MSRYSFNPLTGPGGSRAAAPGTAPAPSGRPAGAPATSPPAPGVPSTLRTLTVLGKAASQAASQGLAGLWQTILHGGSKPPALVAPKPPVSVAKPPSPQALAIKQMVTNSGVLNADGTRSPLTKTQAAFVTRSLTKFDAGQVDLLNKGGVTITIVDAAKTPKGGYPGLDGDWLKDAGGKDPAGGYYETGGKHIVLRNDYLASYALQHEAGHAMDDALEVDHQAYQNNAPKGYVELLSDEDPALGKLYDGYKTRGGKSAKAVWSDYALNNNHEYLAAGVESYLGTPQERQDLKKKDPDMYAYVKTFLARASREDIDKNPPDAQPPAQAPPGGSPAPPRHGRVFTDAIRPE